jgi:hypothetical protein
MALTLIKQIRALSDRHDGWMDGRTCQSIRRRDNPDYYQEEKSNGSFRLYCYLSFFIFQHRVLRNMEFRDRIF